MANMTEADGIKAMYQAIADHVEGSGQGGTLTNDSTKAAILLALVSGEETGKAILDLINEVITTEGWHK